MDTVSYLSTSFQSKKDMKDNSRYNKTIFLVLQFICTMPLSIFLIFNSCVEHQEPNPESEAMRLYKKAMEIGLELPRKSLQLLLLCDSLLHENEEEQTLIVNVKRNIASKYTELGYPDSARHYYLEVLNYEVLEEGIASIYMGIGNNFMMENKPDSAKMYLETAIEIFEKAGIQSRLGRAQLNLANILREEGSFDKALSIYLENVKYFEAEGDYSAMIAALGNIGFTYNKLKNYKDAKAYYHQGLELIKARGILNMLPGFYMSLGDTHYELHEYDSAMVYLKLCLLEDIEERNPLLAATNYYNIGKVYNKKELLDSAEFFFNKSIAIKGESDYFNSLQVVNRLGLATLQYKRKEYDLAISDFEELLKDTNFNLDNNYKEDVYENLFTMHKYKNNFGHALHYHERLLALKDSLSNQSIREQVIELEKKYQSKIKNDEIKYLQQIIRKDRLISYGTIGILVLAVLLLVFATLWFSRKRLILEKEKEFEEEEKQIIELKLDNKARELTSNMLHLVGVHDIAKKIKNELQSLIKDSSELENKDFSVVFSYLNNQINPNRWAEFYERFDEIDRDFLTRITGLYPDLTPTEVRLCILLRLNLSTKDICFLTSRSLRTVENIRYRMRKKMELKKNASLTLHILSI